VSLERVERKRSRPVWRVRWYDDRGQRKAKTFPRKEDAEAYEAKVKLAKRKGELEDLDAGRQSLEDFAEEWFRNYADPRLAATTLEHYRGLRDRYIIPRLGKLQLRRLKPETIQRFQTDLASEGVGQETIRKTLVLLQGMLERAVEWGRIQANPARVIKKPRASRSRAVEPMSPETVEALRGRLRQRDAVLVSVLAYGGLRPGEALALTWADVRGQTIVVDKALALGETKETKTRRNRTVRLLKPLASDLAAWRMACGRPPDSEHVFPMKSGGLWTDSAYRNWRTKVYVPAAKAVGIKSPRLYDIRHSAASLMFAEGRNPAEIAEHMGHSIQTLLGTYTHVIEELRGKPTKTADDLVRKAREGRAAAASEG
jgi:integrase